MSSKISIILPCKNEGVHLKQTIDFMLRTEAADKAKIIVVNDNSQDRCCNFITSRPKEYGRINMFSTSGLGAARARNLGADKSINAEILVFCDAHIIMQKGWLDTLLDSFNNTEVDVVSPGIGPFDPNHRVGYGQTWDEKLEIKWLDKPVAISEIPLAPGACLAIKKNVFDNVEGFDRGFNSWGYEDVEFSLKLWLMGYKVFINPMVKIGHYFRKVPPYKVDIVEFYYNRLRMAVSHFNKERIGKVIKLIQNSPKASETVTELILSNTLEQRNKYLKNRRYDDDWFFNKFKISF